MRQCINNSIQEQLKSSLNQLIWMTAWDETEGVELYKELSELWQKAGMQTHKWLSNSLKVLENIPPQHRASEVSLDGDEISAVKTLGVLWLATDDVFTFESDVLEKFRETF